MNSDKDENRIITEIKESSARLDALLPLVCENLSRSAAVRLIEEGAVLLNGKTVKKNTPAKAGDFLEITLPEPEPYEPVAQNIPLDIVYEDEHIICINKEKGMVVHPAPGHTDGTLVNALLYHCGDNLSGIGGVKRPGIVHRIDKDTSGLILVAKNDRAQAGLSDQLKDHSMYRIYNAVVCGAMKDSEGTIDIPIARHMTDRKKMAVYPGGGRYNPASAREAVTHWRLLEPLKGYSLIECRLETGRTHQIRVHMQSIGHPCLGDGVYGAKCPDKGLDSQCLHALKLSFIHPITGERMTLKSKLPEYFELALAKCRC